MQETKVRTDSSPVQFPASECKHKPAHSHRRGREHTYAQSVSQSVPVNINEHNPQICPALRHTKLLHCSTKNNLAQQSQQLARAVFGCSYTRNTALFQKHVSPLFDLFAYRVAFYAAFHYCEVHNPLFSVWCVQCRVTVVTTVDISECVSNENW